MKAIIQSIRRIDMRLYVALLLTGMCPAIYTTIRTAFLGQMPDAWAYSIAGQLSWVNLVYEVATEAIILTLYHFLGEARENRREFGNRVKTGILVSGGVFAVISAVVIIFAKQLLAFMATDVSIIDASASYITLECIACIPGVMFDFAMVALVTVGKSQLVYIVTAAKLALCVTCDVFMVSSVPFSLKLGVNGIGCSNIVTNSILFAIVMVILYKQGYLDFHQHLSFAWCSSLSKAGAVSGLESLVRNVAYMLMVARMVNIVQEQGTYWVANNFIWGWLLLPVLQLGELVKRETATDKDAVCKNTLGYFAVTAIICAVWFATLPLYSPFMKHVLQYPDVEKLLGLVLTLLPFYVAFAFQNVFDSTFYGKGKPKYMLFEAVVTNTVYYGGFFIAYLTGAWQPSLNGIALMFGFGCLFDSVVSWLAYRHFLQKEGIDVL